MKAAVWKTGHEIADRVADSMEIGLNATHFMTYDPSLLDIIDHFDIHIGYGILRCMDRILESCLAAGKPFFHIDNGYFKPGHFDGYYRVSLNGTQQTFGLDKLKPDYDRWNALGVEILPKKEGGYSWVHCPPTKPVEQFFKLSLNELPKDSRLKIRDKNTLRPLQSDLDNCRMVTTFNSSVGWEALRQGIPVVSDPNHSIVGAYQKMLDRPIHSDSNARQDLFGIMASLQQTLSEMREGKLWPLLNRLISISDMTPEKK